MQPLATSGQSWLHRLRAPRRRRRRLDHGGTVTYRRSFVAAFVLATLVVAGCSDDKEEVAADADEVSTDATAEEVSAPSGPPILVGNIASLTGPISTKSSADAVRVYLEKWNERGGFDGRPLELVSEDSAVDPAKAQAAAKKLVEQDKVVALVGNSFFFDCALNGPLYQQHDVPWMSLAIDETCSGNPALFPVTPAPSTQFNAMAQHLLDEGKTKLFYVAFQIPGSEVQQQALKAYAEEHGDGATLAGSKLLPFSPAGGPTAADIDGLISDVKAAGADAVISVLDANSLGLALQQAKANGVGADSLTWLAAPAIYKHASIEQFGENGEGLLIGDVFDVVESGDEETGEIAATLEAAGVPFDVFAQAGWAAAALFEQALEAAGTPDPKAITEALAAMSAADVPLVDEPFDFTAAPTPDKPRTMPVSSKVVRIEGGEFVLVTEDWVRAAS